MTNTNPNPAPNPKPQVKITSPKTAEPKATWCKVLIANDIDADTLGAFTEEIKSVEDYLGKTAIAVVGKQLADSLLDKFAKLREARLREVGTDEWSSSRIFFSNKERNAVAKIIRKLTQQDVEGTMKYLEYLNIIILALDKALDITDDDRMGVARKYNNENKIASFTSSSTALTQWQRGHEDKRPRKTHIYQTAKNLMKINTNEEGGGLADIELYELLYIYQGYFVTSYRKLKEARNAGTKPSQEDQAYIIRYVRAFNDAILIKNMTREVFKHRTILQRCTYRSWIGTMDCDIPTTNSKRGWNASDRRKFTRHILGSLQKKIETGPNEDFVERIIAQLINTGTNTEDYAI